MKLPEGVTIIRNVHADADSIVRFPLFESSSVCAGFSWGVNSLSMVGEGSQDHNNLFLKQLGIPTPPRVVRKSVNYNFDRVLKVTEGNLGQLIHDANGNGIQTHADILITDVPNLSLMVTPADCTVSVLHGYVPDSGDVLGVLHSGWRETMSMFPAMMIQQLIEMGCEPDSILMAIAPSIQQNNFWVKPKDLTQRDIYLWGDRVEKDIVDRDGEVIKLDVLGRVLDIVISEGINPNNILAYVVDTFEASLRGEAFSHRAATATGIKELDGRFAVAAALVG